MKIDQPMETKKKRKLQERLQNPIPGFPYRDGKNHPGTSRLPIDPLPCRFDACPFECALKSLGDEQDWTALALVA